MSTIWQAIGYGGGIWDEVEASSYEEAYGKFQEIKRREHADDYNFIRKAENEQNDEEKQA